MSKGYNGRDEGLFIKMREFLDVPAIGTPDFSVMRSCPRLKWEFEHNKFKPQTVAMVEGDRWKRIKENDDLLVCSEYYLQDNPAYLGRGMRKPKGPVLSHAQRGKG